jgi:hypothetical protein
VTVVDRLSAPAMPDTASGYVPGGVALIDVTRRIDAPVPVTADGRKVPVAPAGSPATLRFTAWLNAFSSPCLKGPFSTEHGKVF